MPLKLNYKIDIKRGHQKLVIKLPIPADGRSLQRVITKAKIDFFDINSSRANYFKLLNI